MCWHAVIPSAVRRVPGMYRSFQARGSLGVSARTGRCCAQDSKLPHDKNEKCAGQPVRTHDSTYWCRRPRANEMRMKIALRRGALFTP